LADIILLIEDEADICRAFSDAMSEQRVRVITASSGEQGIVLYRLHKDEVTLVVLDLSLPGINGEDTYRVLRRMNPEVKVVVSSGYADDYVRKTFRGFKMVGFLQKPYTWGTLVESMMEFLRKARSTPK